MITSLRLKPAQVYVPDCSTHFGVPGAQDLRSSASMITVLYTSLTHICADLLTHSTLTHSEWRPSARASSARSRPTSIASRLQRLEPIPKYRPTRSCPVRCPCCSASSPRIASYLTHTPCCARVLTGSASKSSVLEHLRLVGTQARTCGIPVRTALTWRPTDPNPLHWRAPSVALPRTSAHEQPA